MTPSFSFVAVAVLVGCGFTTVASGVDQPASFESLDRDSDGKVSLNEATVNDSLFVAFQRLDTNKDGELAKEEFARYQGAASGV